MTRRVFLRFCGLLGLVPFLGKGIVQPMVKIDVYRVNWENPDIPPEKLTIELPQPDSPLCRGQFVMFGDDPTLYVVA